MFSKKAVGEFQIICGTILSGIAFVGSRRAMEDGGGNKKRDTHMLSFFSDLFI